ncbi:MAG: hypothetical protein R3D03_13405 [Geminicoccaceae bacterium]
MSRIKIDGDTGHADIAGHPRMVRIVAPVGGEVEGDGKSFCPAARLRR